MSSDKDNGLVFKNLQNLKCIAIVMCSQPEVDQLLAE